MSVAPLFTAAPLNATRFRAAHEGDWARLDAIIGRAERRGMRTLDDEELLALPLLYRTTLSSLSVARETSLERGLVTYLESLCTRAYVLIYGVRTPVWRQLAAFFARGWPEAVRALWRETFVAALLLGLGVLVGFLLVHHDASWFYDIVPGSFSDERTPTASAATLRHSIYTPAKVDDPLATFATFLFTHNAQQSLFAFALGFAFCLPTALLLVYNGVIAGAFFAIYVPKGLAIGFTGWLLIHGTTELFAIVLAGAAGFRIGLALIFPGRLARMDAAVAAGRLGATVMGGVVLMLMIAGTLEGIGRQTVTADAPRLAIGLGVLAGWLAYFYLPRGRRGS